MEKDMHQAPRSGDPVDRALESLLRNASSRPVPAEADRRAVERAVREEWLRVTAGRRRRRRAVALSLAASIVLVVALTLWNGGEPVSDAALAEVARADRVTGRVDVLGGGADASLAGGMSVRAGETLRTAVGSGAALRLQDGISLRVDEESAVEFISGHSLALHAGRIYVDTGWERARPAAAPGGSGSDFPLEILTSAGTVRHFGTRYMVGFDDRRLEVRVRSGAVRFVAFEDGAAAVFVSDGQQLSFAEGSEPELAPTDIHGDQWQWAEELGPGFVLDGRSMAEFLAWVARETGLELKYLSSAAQLAAERTILHGKVDLPAREALDVVLMSSDLSATIGDGSIEVSVRP